jgi:hypothetical protein
MKKQAARKNSIFFGSDGKEIKMTERNETNGKRKFY